MTNATHERGLWTRLYHGETRINFLNASKWFFLASGIIIVLGLLSLTFNGLNRGIEFRGGTSWEIPAHKLTVAKARSTLPAALRDAKVQQLGSGAIRIEADPKSTEAADKITVDLAKAAHVQERQISVNSVGPTWGKEITAKAQRALEWFLVLVGIFIAVRFSEWKMAVTILIALVHDILITVGVYSLFKLEVTPPTVIAILTILGYSIYDGIVVFDKVEENTKPLAVSGRMTYTDMVNVSLNQTLMRSVNTTLTAVMPILSLLVIGAFILGATTLEEFAIALLIGLASGAYSSIFIASPILAWLKEREPRFAAVRDRLARGVGGGGPLVPGVATVGAAGSGYRDRDTGGAAPLVPGQVLTGEGASRPASAPITARARKKGRRR
ncbi:MAG TPA: protein translocase subunit SecF [Acidimicrobiales bacterium]|nr:protein translocase subunit SecF [Acidimicrobiales bacterium]